ncbi:MAG: type II toxin-antitoxin system HicB family antitoxin [Simkania negevensis]|nr:type II toxin-antitoxin system HicB family antitoxin [Simkania negevensis]
MMKYKGYYGQVTYDNEAKIFHGEIVGIRAVITFQGTTVDEIESAFRDSVNDYLDWCKKRRKAPEKSFSGKLNLRMKQDLHARLAMQAQEHQVSLNSYINECLEKVAG